MVSIAVCDDDRDMLDKLEGCIKAHAKETSEVVKVKTFSCSENFAMSVTDGDSYDMYILDVEMPGMNGMELAARIRSVQPAAIIIFITYYINYAPQGFKVNAFRYVMKLKLEQELEEALDKAFEELTKIDDESLLCSSYNSLTRIFLRDIIYMQRHLRHTEIHTAGQGIINDRRSIRELIDVMGDVRFFITERSYAINLSFVERADGFFVTLTNHEKIPISRDKKTTLGSAMCDYLGQEPRQVPAIN